MPVQRVPIQPQWCESENFRMKAICETPVLLTAEKEIYEQMIIHIEKLLILAIMGSVWRSYARTQMTVIARQRDFRFFSISPESRVHNLNRQTIRDVLVAG
jgi:hypothetical protein